MLVETTRVHKQNYNECHSKIHIHKSIVHAIIHKFMIMNVITVVKFIHLCTDSGGVGSMTPLLLACEAKHKEVAQYLTKKLKPYYVGKFLYVSPHNIHYR